MFISITLNRLGRSWSTRRILWPAVFFLGITLLLTWPLSSRMGDSIIYYSNDSLYFVWLVDWFRTSLLQLNVSPLWVPWLNYPEGYSLAYNEFSPAMVFMAWPFSILGGSVFAYNAAMIMALSISGYGAYLWAYRLTANHRTAIIAGVVFAFNPYHLWRVGGQLNLIGTHWLPFFFMYVWSLLRCPHWSGKNVVVGAIFLALVGFTSLYLLYMSLILSTVFILSHLLMAANFAPRWKLAVRHVLALFGLAATLMLPVLIPYVRLASITGQSKYSYEEVRFYSASPTSFFVPHPFHFAMGFLNRADLDPYLGPAYPEHWLYLGVIALGLASASVLGRRARRTFRNERPLLWTGFAALCLALGTDLHLAGQSVIVDVPKFIQPWHPYEHTFLPLPDYFLYKYLPFYGLMRVWTRYTLLVSLFLAILAGLGAHRLLHSLSRRAVTPVTAAIVVLLLFDYGFFPNPMFVVQPRPVDKWIAAQLGDGAVIQLPIWDMLIEPPLTFYASAQHRPFIGGNFAALQSPQFQRIRPVLEGFPDDASVRQLKDFKTQYVIIDTQAFPNLAQARPKIEALGLMLRYSSDAYLVYELP